MADPYHHAVSSVRKWGGEVDDYLPIHAWFDQTKAAEPSFRHRAGLHHTLGIHLCVEHFGPALTLATGKVIPTRWVAEQHVLEDLGRIPSIVEYYREVTGESWMFTGARRLRLEET